MKKTLLINLFTLLVTAIVSAQLPTIKASSKKVDINDGGQLSQGNWILNPELELDIYKTKVEKGTKLVTFYTDQDSISFNVERGKTYDFVILLNEKDSCRHQINTIPDFNFTSSYVKKHKGTYSFEIPEVQELVHIMFAITATGKADENMVEKQTEYYKEVIAHFDAFASDKIIQDFDQLLKKGWYSVLKMDACSFNFEGNQIKKDSIYNKLSWSGPNYIEPYISEIEKFAKKTNFRDFYKAHLPYYDKLKMLMDEQTPIEKQWKWIEEQFNITYDNYRVTFSPLVYGNHSTNRFTQDDFKQTVMFICGPYEDESIDAILKEGVMSRIVFTEIDHNYVNPTSDKYTNEIKEALSTLSKWANTNALRNYRNPYDVFNEYMTFGVFTAYAMDNFSESDFVKINERVETLMSKHRGFIQFKAFNQFVIQLYGENRTDKKFQELYPELIQWFNNQ